MRIMMFNDDFSICNAAVPLRELARSSQPVEATIWHRLLELVAYLEAGTPDCDVECAIVLKELRLSKPFPPDPDRERLFKKFIEEWRASHPDSAEWGNEIVDAAWPFFNSRRDSIRVTIDWPDYGPVENGLPITHYRFRIERAGCSLSEDARANDLTRTKQIICNALNL